jgi:hypothetical protein
VFSIIGAILQFILALFREKQRGDIEDAGAAKAEVETSRRADKMIEEGRKARENADTSEIMNDPNNRLRR